MSVVFAMAQSPTLPAGIVAAVNQFTDFLLRYVSALAAVGALSMALIELAKRLFDCKTRFQALRWTRWVTGTAFDPPATMQSYVDSYSALPQTPSRLTAYAELLQLCTGVSRDEASVAAGRLLERGGNLPFFHAFIRTRMPAHAVFGLDLERMMGSIQEAADVVLASPAQQVSLYLLLTSGAAPADIAGWYRDGTSAMTDVSQPDASSEQRRRIKEQADRFARLRQVVKRKLDGFQLYTGDSWGSWNQFLANVVGVLILFLTLIWMRAHSDSNSPHALTILGFSLLGGILSPIAKDLVTALKRVRDG